MELNNTKILLIDDDSLVSRMYEQGLSRYGATVVLAHNGSEGIAKVRDDHFDCVLLDLMMPNIDGFQVLKHIKQNEEIKNTPVIILTNLRDNHTEIEKVKALGPNEYLIKSEISLEQLAKKIRQHLISEELIENSTE